MSEIPTFFIPSALVTCWQKPLLARTGKIVRLWPTDPSRLTSLECPEGMGLFRVSLGGAATDLRLHYGPTLRSFEVVLEWLERRESLSAALQGRLSPRMGRRVQMNLHGLLARALVGSGAIEMGFGTPGRAVFSVPRGWLDETMPALVEQADRCRLIPPDTPDEERHARGLAMDEVGVLTRSSGHVRLFAGQTVLPATGELVGYVAIDPVHRLRSVWARRLAADLEQCLLARGAIRLVTGTPKPLMLA